MIRELLNLPYFKIRKLLLAKDVSALEVLKHFLDIASINKYNAYREINYDLVKIEALGAMQRFTNKKYRYIECFPISVKDNFCIKNMLTTSCSKITQSFIPTYHSTIVSKIKKNGGVIIGRTSMDEFASGSFSTSSYFGESFNIVKKSYSSGIVVAGGSSGGSALSVLTSSCLAALGTDTGGSTRLPGHFTGTVAFKPAYTSCSRYGLIPLASSLDHVGIISSCVDDAMLLFNVLYGFSNDMICINSTKKIKLVNKIKIGIPIEYINNNINNFLAKTVCQCITWIKEEGHFVIDISMPSLEYAFFVYYILTSAEVFSNMNKYDNIKFKNKQRDLNNSISITRGLSLGKKIKTRILTGAFILSKNEIITYYQKAQEIRKIIVLDFLQTFHKVDIVFIPICHTGIPFLYLSDHISKHLDYDWYNVPSNIAGLPSISISIGLSEHGVPISVQILSNICNEDLIFKIAKIIENKKLSIDE